MATSYANPGGTGARTGSITVTSSGTGATGTPPNLVDGSFTQNSTNSMTMGTGGWSAGSRLTFNFGTAGKVINELKWYQNTTDTHGAWKFRGSPDGVNFTDLGSSFTLGGTNGTQTITAPSANTTAYHVYALELVTGPVSNGPFIEEVEFKIDVGVVNFPMSLTAGSYAVAGVALVLKRAARFVLTAGSYAITGAAVSLAKGKWLSLTAGSYAVTGVALILSHLIPSSRLLRKIKPTLKKLRVTDPTLED